MARLDLFNQCIFSLPCYRDTKAGRVDIRYLYAFAKRQDPAINMHPVILQLGILFFWKQRFGAVVIKIIIARGDIFNHNWSCHKLLLQSECAYNCCGHDARKYFDIDDHWSVNDCFNFDSCDLGGYLVGLVRWWLGAHTSGQIFLGYSIGISMQLIAYLILGSAWYLWLDRPWILNKIKQLLPVISLIFALLIWVHSIL